MKVSIKRLVGTKWELLPAMLLIDTSVARYLDTTHEICIAALLDDEDKPLVFISNSKEQLDKYKDRGICLHSTDVIALLGANHIPDIAVKTFPDCKFVEFKQPDPITKWW